MAARRRRRAPQATEYVEGNTVRKIERAPQYEGQERRKQKKRNSSHTVTVRRNQEKALQMNLFSVLLLTVAVICTLGSAAIYTVITVPTSTLVPGSSLVRTTQPDA